MRFEGLIFCLLIVFGGWQLHTSVPNPKQGNGRRFSIGSRRGLVVRAASSSAESSGSSSNIAPLKLESPVGQFLSQILVSHPHLMSAAVERQLEQLQTDRDGYEQKEKPSASGTDLVLYRFGLYTMISDILLYHHICS